MHVEFATAGRIVFGAGAVADLPHVVRSFGASAFVVTGRHPHRHASIIESLAASDVACDLWPTSGEPTLAVIAEGVRRLREGRAGVVVAIGGGSVIDAGKAVAALATNHGDILDYLEVVGAGRPLLTAPLPCIAVPTTAGTGSEVTKNAVLGVPEHGIKVSLRGASMVPRVALVDPELALDLPPAVTASTGLDALTQLIEPYVSSKANPLVDALCLEGLRRAAGAIRVVYADGRDRTARESMALASLFSGLALANAGLGAVHGLAAPIGGRVAAPHGAVCAALLPHVCAMNLRAIEAREPAHAARDRYLTIARLLTGNTTASAADGIAWLRALVADLGIPRLRVYGVGVSDIGLIADQAARASSMKANPIPLTRDELCEILLTAI